MMCFTSNFVNFLMVGLTLHLFMVNGIPVSSESSLQPLITSLNETTVNSTTNLNASIVLLNNSSNSPVNSTLLKNGIRNGTVPDKRLGKFLGLELGLGLGLGLGYGGYGGYGGFGGYGNVPFPCSTSRLASFGFPYYNPVCYGYAVPSFPYYGGPLG